MGQFDPVAERSELLNHSCRPPSLGLLANRRASFFVTDSLVQNLPDQSAKPVSNYSDRLIVPQARYVPAIEDLEDASFIFNRSVGSLIEDAPHMTVTLRGPVGNRHMRRILNQAANAAVKYKGSIFEIAYRRLVPRLGHNQSIGAIGNRLCRLIAISI